MSDPHETAAAAQEAYVRGLAEIASLRARLAEAAAGMERAVRERDEARAAAMELTLRSRLGAYRELAAKHADALHELNALRFTQDAIRAERDAAIARATEAENRAATAETLRLAAIASRGRAENERDAAIARAEKAERDAALERADWADAAMQRDAERAAREKAEAACAEMREAIAALLQECDECDESPGRWMHTGSTVSTAAIEAQQTKAGSALLAELYALRAVRDAAGKLRGMWLHCGCETGTCTACVLRAALDAVPKEKP